ncbi:MAG: flavin reductase family protein [Clostridia bacterium]|nr:flavin reductase family protein [Clostridia bacterium]
MYRFGNFAQETLEQLSGTGAFLTVKNGEKVNTMTIGWGSLSQYWGEEIFIAPVRRSRYTFELLQNAKSFTVSVPAKGTMAEELKLCGTVSGRDTDKTAKLPVKPAETTDVPLVDGCAVYYECELLFAMEMKEADLPADIAARWYGTHDMHSLFFGRIVSAHR